MTEAGDSLAPPRGLRRRLRRPSFGLRGKLAIIIALVAAVGVGVGFAAVYTVVSAQLRGQLDAQLRTQAAQWGQFSATARMTTPGELRVAARRFIAGRRYQAESLVIAVQIGGGATVSNDPEIIDAELRSSAGGIDHGLLSAPAGFSDREIAEAGLLRVLTEPIGPSAGAGSAPRSRASSLGTLRFAYSLRPLSNVQSSLLHTYILVGLLVVGVAVAVGAGLATIISAPLRRMATVAATAGAGDLSVRAGSVGGRDEVAALARGFNQMLVRLQRAFARQRQFVDDASHELRTPLAVARVQVELLDRETDPARRHQANGTLLRRLDEIDHLIGDMLTLASADGGTLIEPEPIDLVGFFADLSRDLPLFGDRDYRVLGVSGTLEADPRRLTQVIRNLIRNAVDHTHAGDLIELCARVEGDRLRITVSDAGPGIPPEQLERVFERFHRLEHSRSHATGGTGLGLPIARAIVEAHGGTIWARSTSGHGATFQFELPGYRPPAAGITLDDSSVLPAGST